jgi:hypothetical protein
VHVNTNKVIDGYTRTNTWSDGHIYAHKQIHTRTRAYGQIDRQTDKQETSIENARRFGYTDTTISRFSLTYAHTYIHTRTTHVYKCLQEKQHYPSWICGSMSDHTYIQTRTHMQTKVPARKDATQLDMHIPHTSSHTHMQTYTYVDRSTLMWSTPSKLICTHSTPDHTHTHTYACTFKIKYTNRSDMHRQDTWSHTYIRRYLPNTTKSNIHIQHICSHTYKHTQVPSNESTPPSLQSSSIPTSSATVPPWEYVYAWMCVCGHKTRTYILASCFSAYVDGVCTENWNWNFTQWPRDRRTQTKQVTIQWTRNCNYVLNNSN